MFDDWLHTIDFTFPQRYEVGLPETAALAAVALIGYLFGHRSRHKKLVAINAQRCRELERASEIARQLETIADRLRQDLAGHHGQLARFKRRLIDAQEDGNDQAWQMLCNEAELILAPTMQLAQQLSLAYDSIRQQLEGLETFTEARTDPLTGVGNGRALQEKIEILLSAAGIKGGEFSVVLVALDRGAAAESDSKSKSRLPELARLIRSCMRDTDFAARYGDEEFVVVMPHTKLAGATVFGDRLRKWAVDKLGETLSCGIAEYQPQDDFKSLLGRADSAFYSAKAAGGGNRQFVHTGTQIREHRDAAHTESPRTPVPVLPVAATAAVEVGSDI